MALSEARPAATAGSSPVVVVAAAGAAETLRRDRLAETDIEGGLALSDVPDPVPSPGEALVRVSVAGICGTDLELVKGYSGFHGTPGHEFVGVVEASADRTVLIGKRVVGEINAGCGVCELCTAGDSRHCPSRTVLGIVGRDGAHAEFLKLPSRNLFEVPGNVTEEAAVFVEPLAAAIGINERFQFAADSNVAVIGDGKLGILCARALNLMPPSKSVTMIGRNDENASRCCRGPVWPTRCGNRERGGGPVAPKRC